MASTRMKDEFTTHCFRIGLRRAVKSDMTEASGLKHHQDAKLRVADAYRLLQYGLKHWLQVARGAGYDAQHLRAAGLLLQCFGKMLSRVSELAGALFELLFQFESMRLEFLFQLGASFAATNARSWLRSGRWKFASSRLVFRALARQGHPSGTSIDPGPPGHLKDITAGSPVSEPRSADSRW